MSLEENSNRERQKTLESFRPPPIQISLGPQDTANENQLNVALGENVFENKNIPSAANSDGIAQNQDLLTDKNFKKRSKVKYYKEFEFYLRQQPKSCHGRMILYWDRVLEDYNDRDVYYYKSPNLQLSDVKTVLKDLKSNVKHYDPKSINNILCGFASSFFIILITAVCILLYFTLDINDLLIYIIPIYFIVFVLTLIASWYISNMIAQRTYVKRLIAIKKKLDDWNKNKFLEQGLEQKIDGFGAWLEISHEVRDYGVYVNYCDERGFTADSDALQSPTKISETPTLYKYPDSWTNTNPITPRLQFTPIHTNVLNSRRKLPSFHNGQKSEKESNYPSDGSNKTVVFDSQPIQLDKSIFNIP